MSKTYGRYCKRFNKNICLLKRKINLFTIPDFKNHFNYRCEIVIKINCKMDFEIENEIYTDVPVTSNSINKKL